jgi:RNA polymerase sigma-70 factor (ECF subfamily)
MYIENEQSQDVFIIKNIDSSGLVKHFQNGEIEAFDEIVERYRSYVYISQDIFIKVFKSLSTLKKASIFNIWLRKMTVNACIDYIRQKSKEQILCDLSEMTLNTVACSDSELPDHRLDILELREMILKAVDRLPKRRKKVFILRHYENLSLEEIAQTLDCSVGTVKAHLFIARHDLKNILSPYLLT